MLFGSSGEREEHGMMIGVEERRVFMLDAALFLFGALRVKGGLAAVFESGSFSHQKHLNLPFRMKKEGSSGS